MIKCAPTVAPAFMASAIAQLPMEDSFVKKVQIVPIFNTFFRGSFTHDRRTTSQSNNAIPLRLPCSIPFRLPCGHKAKGNRRA